MQTLPQLAPADVAELRRKHLAIPRAGQVAAELGARWVEAIDAFKATLTEQDRARMDHAHQAYREAKRLDDETVRTYLQTERRAIARARWREARQRVKGRAPTRAPRSPRRARSRARRCRVRAAPDAGDGPSSGRRRRRINQGCSRDPQGREGEAMPEQARVSSHVRPVRGIAHVHAPSPGGHR